MTKVENSASKEGESRLGGTPGGAPRDRLGIYEDSELLPVGRRTEEEHELLRHGKFGTRREIDDMHRKARTISQFLKTIGNDVRLLVLCHLIQHKELTVGELMSKIPPTSQSSLSQHLAKMRELGLITFRRDSQTLHYRIKDPRVIQVLSTLKKVFCDDLDAPNERPKRAAANGNDAVGSETGADAGAGGDDPKAPF